MGRKTKRVAEAREKARVREPVGARVKVRDPIPRQQVVRGEQAQTWPHPPIIPPNRGARAMWYGDLMVQAGYSPYVSHR